MWNNRKSFFVVGLASVWSHGYNGHMQESRPEGRALEINREGARLILNEISSHLVHYHTNCAVVKFFVIIFLYRVDRFSLYFLQGV